MWGIQWSLVNFPRKGQWHRVFKFSLICAWINGWVNTCEAGPLRRHRPHYGVIIMKFWDWLRLSFSAVHIISPSNWWILLGYERHFHMCYAVPCHYSVVNFLTNMIHKIHPIARLLGRGMQCLLWIHHLIDILPQFLQLFIVPAIIYVITYYSGLHYNSTWL